MRLSVFLLIPFSLAAEQFQLFAPAPTLTGSGSFIKDFDPGVYGPIQRFSVFSATGDALAYATVSDRHIEIQYSSLSRGIGQLPALPILTIDVPRLSPPADAPIIDSVQPVTPATFRIAGANFTASTPVSIDGVLISSVDFVSGSQLTVTLPTPIDLTGKHLHVGAADYFISLATNRFVPSIATFTAAQFINHRFTHPQFQQFLVLLNPGATSITAVIYVPGSRAEVLTVPPYETLSVDIGGFASQPNLWLAASAPIRAVTYAHAAPLGPTPAQTFLESPMPSPTVPPIGMPVSTNSISWSWQSGTPAPAPATVNTPGNLPFTVNLPNVPWLAVASSANAVTLLPTPQSLAPGNYKTTIAVTPVLPGFATAAATIDVSLTVSSAPLIGSTGSCCNFVEPFRDNPATGPFTLNIASNGGPVDVVAAASGAPWLSVTPARATTPASFTIAAHPEGMNLAPGTYQAAVTFQGPANTLTFPVSLMVFGGPAPNPNPTLLAGPLLNFAREIGSPRLSQPLFVSPAVPVTVTSDVTWLTTTSSPPAVTLDIAGLAPGAYKGTVTVTSETAGFAKLPAALFVVAPPTNLIVSPSSIDLSGPVNQAQAGVVTVDTNGPPVLFSYGFPQTFAAAWQPGVTPQSAYLGPTGQLVTPATLSVIALISQPGRYVSSILLQTTDGKVVTIPVTYTATPSSAAPPLLAHIVNAASMRPGPLAPNQYFTLFGDALAPSSQVLVNGSPVEVFYSSPGQLNARAPANIDGSATVQVELLGARSAMWSIPVVKALPAIFTLDGSGVGPAAVLNQDNSINTATTPAARGTILQIFTNCPPPDKVTIGGIDAVLQYAGPNQVNAVIPATVAAGPAVPITIAIGDAFSPPVTTVAIR